MRAETFLLLTVLTGLSSCCDERILQEERSPSGNKIAAVIYSDCGVLADGTSVTLRDSRSSRQDLVVSAEGHHVFVVFWEGEQTLRVFVPETALAGGFANPQIIHQKENVNGTRIEYLR